MRRFAFVLALVASLAACEDRAVGPSSDGAVAPDGQARDNCASTADGAPRRDGSAPDRARADAQPAPRCTIAIRVDDCCTSAQPALTAQMENDPCLVPYPPPAQIPAVCKAKWTVNCDLIDCTWQPPPSRVVGVVPGGSCHWANECLEDGECVVARSLRRCCACPAAYPVSLVNQDPCLVNDGAPSGNCVDAADCKAVKCAPCPEVPVLKCEAEDPTKSSSMLVCKPYGAI